jgi:hypothetical protein
MPLNLTIADNCLIKLNPLMGFNKEFILLLRLILVIEMRAKTH